MSAKEYLRSITQYAGRFHIDEVCAHMEAYHAAAMAEIRKEVVSEMNWVQKNITFNKRALQAFRKVLRILDKHLKP